MRVSAVRFTVDDGVVAYYDGRASAAENYEERMGVATRPDLVDPTRRWASTRTPVPPRRPPLPRHHRPARTAGQRLYYEWTRPDGAHDLCTELFQETRGSPERPRGTLPARPFAMEHDFAAKSRRSATGPPFPARSCPPGR